MAPSVTDGWGRWRMALLERFADGTAVLETFEEVHVVPFARQQCLTASAVATVSGDARAPTDRIPA
jgi:hypothetical protein